MSRRTVRVASWEKVTKCLHLSTSNIPFIHGAVLYVSFCGSIRFNSIQFKHSSLILRIESQCSEDWPVYIRLPNAQFTIGYYIIVQHIQYSTAQQITHIFLLDRTAFCSHIKSNAKEFFVCLEHFHFFLLIVSRIDCHPFRSFRYQLE